MSCSAKPDKEAASLCAVEASVATHLRRLRPYGVQLNRLYLLEVASREDVALLLMQPAGNDAGRACHVTCAALAWVLCAQDAMPPYTADGVWSTAAEGWGCGSRVVAGSNDKDEGFDADHVALVVGDVVFDSFWQKRTLSVQTLAEAQASTFAHYVCVRHQPLAVDVEGLPERVAALISRFSTKI